MQKFFLVIRPSEGVSLEEPDSYADDNFDTCLLNLLQCDHIRFDKNDHGHSAIHLTIGDRKYALRFKQSAMEEYRRYKREITAFQIG